MPKRYIVDLAEEERAGLLALLDRDVAPARRLTRARILLLADEGGTDPEIAAALHVHAATVERTRRRLVEGGVERALSDKPRPRGAGPSSTARGRRTWWRWPAARRPRVVAAGPCSSWPTGWSS